MRVYSWQFMPILNMLTVAGCSMDSDAAPPGNGAMVTGPVHVMPVRDSDDRDNRVAAAAPRLALAGAHLSYHGGKVLQNVHVTKVLYGPGTYIPELTSTTGVNMVRAYTQMVTSGVFDWLAEYNTTSPAQIIGRGAVGASVQIAPDSSRNGTTIDDSAIQAEIEAQIRTGGLPAPTDNQLYMVHFPSGKTITEQGTRSCVPGGFCAYHSTFKIGSQNVYYGVLPALSNGCATGCGSGTAFQNAQSVSSHELIEAVTDAEVGLATAIGPPLAWYDPNHGEIGDICNGQQGTFAGTDGNTYTMQKEFSNQQSDCITTQAVSPPNPAQISSRTMGDFNGDGRSDILWRNTSGTVGIWLMGPSGTVQSRLTLPDVIGTDFQIQGSGNFDGDAAGTADILWRRTDGTVGIWLMAASGSVASKVTLPFVIGTDWQIQGTGDFNGDGRSDILWRDASGTVGIWLMGSGGTVQARLTLPFVIGTDWQIQGTGNFDGDTSGTADILWRRTDGTVGLWLMGSGGTVASRVTLPFVIGNDWQIQGSGDFDGDGQNDLLWRNTAGTVGLWLMGPGGTVRARITLTDVIGDDYQIQRTGNADGDGAHTSDILWRRGDGTVGIWLMIGGVVFSKVNLPFAIGNDWQIQG